MTEEEWLASDSPLAMLRELPGWDGHRRMRLFACAVVRSRWDTLDGHPDSREAVEYSEHLADGGQGDPLMEPWPAAKVISTEGVHAAPMMLRGEWVSQGAVEFLLVRGGRGDRPLDWGHCARLLRDVVGDPFRPPPTRLHSPAERRAAFHPKWLTTDVLALARAAYQDRPDEDGLLDLTDLLVLSDALTDAGCTDEHLLAHLRQEGVHVRGCRALDLVLGY